LEQQLIERIRLASDTTNITTAVEWVTKIAEGLCTKFGDTNIKRLLTEYIAVLHQNTA